MIKPGPQTLGASLVDELVKNRHAMQETPVWFLGWEDLLEKSISYSLQYSWASLMAQLVKDLPAMRETWVRSPGWEDALKKGKATHSSIRVWRISWTLQFMGLQSIGFHFHIDIFQSKNMTICVSMKLQKTDFHPFSHRNKMMFWKVGICKHIFAEKKKKLCRKVFSAGRPFSLH